jgi:prepilin-type N-terminal cleavage/methylation domain-containing protein
MKPSANIFRRNLGPGGGFTIIEMLAVIVILAILVTLGVRIGAYVRDEGKRKTTRAAQSIVMNAISKFHEMYDKYPTDSGGETGLLTILKGDTTDALFTQTFGRAPNAGEVDALNLRIKSDITPKLGDLPKATLTNSDFLDGWLHPMQYSATGGPGGTPVLISRGANDNFGTADDIRSSDSQ